MNCGVWKSSGSKKVVSKGLGDLVRKVVANTKIQENEVILVPLDLALLFLRLEGVDLENTPIEQWPWT